MKNKYVVKFQCDVKGELNERQYEPTITDFKQDCKDMLESLTTSYDHLSGGKEEIEIVAKVTIDHTGQGYYGSIVLSIDGSKYVLPVDVHEPVDNSDLLVAEFHKKIVNTISHIKA